MGRDLRIFRLLLSGIGLFGLMSYTVARRTREVGIASPLARNRYAFWA